MSNSFLLWNYQNPIQIDTNISESVLKVASINKHVYILTVVHQIYHGEIDDKNHLTLEKYDGAETVDIDSCNNYLYTVNVEGEVHKRDENLRIITEICLYEESRSCLHGHVDTKKFKVPVRTISINKFGHVFITDTGQLWASGYMPQIGIHSDLPKKVTFFDGRIVYSACVGFDFAVAVVNKHNTSEDTDSEEGDEKVFLSSCPQCLSTSPMSPNSTSENFPLDLIKLHNSYDIETTSTSSKNSGSSFNDIERPPVLNGKESPIDEKSGKNIIFRNTEAAKQFLTKKISWMSSAGEEYLAECAEKPSRIIKENVTNMASFVYEGVKTVGDKVATLSRHVSGSSECNDAFDINEGVNITRNTSKEDFLWSLSQCTSEQDQSDDGFNVRVNLLLKKGSDLINCEVWTWGNISHGQLGIGDSIRRERPMIISKLSSIGVCKISVESYHVSVLTLDGRAFLWGRNDHNQVTFDNRMDQSSPKVFAASPDKRTKDVMCGCYHTVILSDNINLKYIGINAENVAQLHTETVEELVSEELGVPNNSYKRPLFCDVLCSCNYTILNNVANSNSFLSENLSKLQKNLEVMLVVQTNVVKLLTKKCSFLPDCSLYERFCESFTNLLHVIAVNIHSMLEFRYGIILEGDVAMFGHVEEFLLVYKKYLESLCDVLCVNGFKCILKVLDIPQHMYKLTANVSKKDKNSDELLLNALFKQPYDTLNVYLEIVEDLKTHSRWERKVAEIKTKWVTFKEQQEEELANAERTRQFWLDSGKTIDFLKSPDRRLIRESNTHPIYLSNAGRFSSHYFILLSDSFIHVYNSLPTVHPLKTVWIDPQPSDTPYQYPLNLRMPEDTLILYTSEPEDKINWFHILQDTIKTSLNKKEAHQPPLTRTASYTFSKNPVYKDARYTGRWLNGKMHGVGKLEWPDGRVYTGQFSHNQMSGFGRMEMPDFGVYEGQWKENQQNGIGILSYTNGDIYKGSFKDGLPHGHGILRKGSFNTTTASIYIGEWIAGNKSGYGVMDDIMAGEKYLGNWSDNKKHGNGVIVTSEGVYYEGTFNQDVFTGFGLMILKDGTYYEGEFKGLGVLGGKGKLTMQSGHMLDGNLSGSWSEGVKVSNATLTKANPDNYVPNNKPSSFETLCIPVSLKWKALFLLCYQALGISDSSPNNNRNSDTKKIWHNVAVYLSNSKQHSLKKSGGDRSLENSLNNLDVIPPYGRDNLDTEAYAKLKQYLTKAFETVCHPLGSLLNDLCEAYTTTYGGMVAHPLLLSHAVSELHSITRRLYEVVRLLFPALPAYGRECLLKNEECGDVASCQSLLFPIILPKVYSSLFILYVLKNEQQEIKYWKRIMEWNRQSDYTLMSFLCVHPKFLNPNQAIPTKDHMFLEAVETLQQLKTTFSPTEKLSVIQDTIKKMTPVARDILGDGYIWNMDDLFPVFLYVVVRARILQLGSELDFIENFMEPSLESGELGIMFTTLKACYQHILQEKATINT